MSATTDTLGLTMKNTRSALGMTQEQLAKHLGVSKRYIMLLEKNRKKPSYDLLFRIIQELNIQPDLIFYPKKPSKDSQTEDTAQENLCRERGIRFVSGKGRRKDPEQKRCERLREIVSKWEEYERHLEIMGPDRNSYSKTDHDATFMRMKDDHIRNAQLKPGYNVQVGVSGEYIVGIQAFPNRSDSGTLIPFLENLDQIHGRKFDSVTADAGFESLENYLYLKENDQACFIKPSNYESSKKKNKNWIGRREDMHYAPEQDAYICHGGMTFWPVGERRRKSETGFISSPAIYQGALKNWAKTYKKPQKMV